MSQSVLSGDSRVGINNQHLLEKVNGYRGVCQYLFPAILFIFRKRCLPSKSVSLGTTVDKSRGSRDGKDFTKFTV
jgi:hypothetical protein